MKVICFHKPEEENGYLSNWYRSDFEIDGHCYTTNEQYMMYRKAALFHDPEIAAAICSTSDPEKIKALGRKVYNYDDRIWNGFRQLVVYDGLMAKFSQNNMLKRHLLETGDSLLAECAAGDRVWGIGLSMKSDKRFEPAQWRGDNLLGFTLMEVRRVLRSTKK